MPIGTAISMAYKVPLIVPKINGTRLSFGSKSSVPPVDCQINSGVSYPSYHTEPNKILRVTSGWGFEIPH